MDFTSAKAQRPGGSGPSNSFVDVDALIKMLWRITRGDYHGEYHQIRETGEFVPAGHRDSFAEYFSLSASVNRRPSAYQAWA